MYETLQLMCSGDKPCILKGFYDALAALDVTASAVLIFDGILVVAAASAAHRQGVVKNEQQRAYAVLILALLAAGFCLRVSQVSYPFHGYITTDQAGALDYLKEFKQLDYEVKLRTILFWIATGFSTAAVAIPALSLPFEFLPKWAARLLATIVAILLVAWIVEFVCTLYQMPR